MDNINISLADPVRSLLDEIANIDPKTRLYRYATARLELTAGDLAECRRAHPDAGYWLSLRAEAGQPGQALPSRSEALTRLRHHGLIDARFFARLLAVRPSQGRAIAGVWRLWRKAAGK